jgi:hypothetical protein
MCVIHGPHCVWISADFVPDRPARLVKSRGLWRIPQRRTIGSNIDHQQLNIVKPFSDLKREISTLLAEEIFQVGKM